MMDSADDVLQTVPTSETTSLSVPDVSVARVFCQPSVIGTGGSGIHVFSLQSNIKCDIYIRKDLVRQSHVVMWHEHVPTYFEEHDNGIDGIGSIHDVFSRASLSSVFFPTGVERLWLHPRWFPCGFGTPLEPLYFSIFFSLSLSDCDTVPS